MQIIKKNGASAFALLLVLAIVVLAFASCNGPTPHIVKVETTTLPASAVQSGPAGQQQITTYKVTVTVENQSSGDGQAQLIVKLVDKSNGQTVADDQQPVHFDGHETQQVDFNFDLPPGDYDTKTQIDYPPD